MIFALILLYGFYNSTKTKSKSIKLNDSNGNKIQNIKQTKETKDYIIHVINHGSNQFNFKGGVMEGGYIPKDDADKVACYVLTLSGKKCSYPKEAQMLFSSSCAGCHGDDGKGIGGRYPDLTKKELLGIQKR